jgi:hypothetical protein
MVVQAVLVVVVTVVINLVQEQAVQTHQVLGLN